MASAARAERRREERAEAKELAKIKYRFPETDEDVIALHKFLCVIAQPILMTPIHPIDSIVEMQHIIVGFPDDKEPYGFAINAEIDGEVIGSVGLVKATWWYNHQGSFFTDRWFFAYPHFHNKGVSTQLLAEAAAVAAQVGIPLVINGKLVRRRPGVSFTRPRVIRAPADVQE